MIEEVDAYPKTIPGQVIDDSVPDYRFAHGVIGESALENDLAVKEQVAQNIFIDSIRSKWGNMSSIASELSLPRHYVEQRIRTDPELWQEYVNAQEMRLDIVEDSVFDKAMSGDMRAASLYMEAKGKHRGWGKETKSLNVGINVKDLSVQELQQIVAGKVPESMK